MWNASSKTWPSTASLVMQVVHNNIESQNQKQRMFMYRYWMHRKWFWHSIYRRVSFDCLQTNFCLLLERGQSKNAATPREFLYRRMHFLVKHDSLELKPPVFIALCSQNLLQRRQVQIQPSLLISQSAQTHLKLILAAMCGIISCNWRLVFCRWPQNKKQSISMHEKYHKQREGLWG